MGAGAYVPCLSCSPVLVRLKYSGSRLSRPDTPKARSKSRVASLHELPEKPVVLMLVAPSGDTVISIVLALMQHLPHER